MRWSYAAFIYDFLFSGAFQTGPTFTATYKRAQRFKRERSERVDSVESNFDVITDLRMSLGEAAGGYETFREKKEVRRKVVLTPVRHL